MPPNCAKYDPTVVPKALSACTPAIATQWLTAVRFISAATL